jgi:putative tryptophan/tyrosine transport system substrate-binding protein
LQGQRHFEAERHFNPVLLFAFLAAMSLNPSPNAARAVQSLFGPHNKETVDETLRYRLPAMFIFKYYVEDGGLVSYGIDIKSNFRRLAEYVAKILNGAKPAELPVEQPTKFELAVNLKTAKAIGIELPTSLLLRADEVIE